MSTQLNTMLLSSMIKSKRGAQGLRETAKEIGNVSASTLSRVEQGKVPDVDTFFKLCKWLNVSSDSFTSGDMKDNQEKTVIKAHLRAEKELEPSTVNSLITMINLAYSKDD